MMVWYRIDRFKVAGCTYLYVVLYIFLEVLTHMLAMTKSAAIW